MRRSNLLLAVTFLILGCNRKEAPVPPAAAIPPPQAMAVPEGNPNLQGIVQETIPAPPYTYLRIKTAAGEVWAGVPATTQAKGALVTVVNPIMMENFESPSLHRTFAQLYLGTLAGAAPVSPASFAPGGAAPAAPVAADEKVAKAAGADACTIAELYARKQALHDQPVTVRGKIVKYNEGILGKTWIHLRDGSGQGAENDITVTTRDRAALGEVVTARGVLRLNKDFGSGYAFAAIVEDAKVTK